MVITSTSPGPTRYCVAATCRSSGRIGHIDRLQHARLDDVDPVQHRYHRRRVLPATDDRGVPQPSVGLAQAATRHRAQHERRQRDARGRVVSERPNGSDLGSVCRVRLRCSRTSPSLDPSLPGATTGVLARLRRSVLHGSTTSTGDACILVKHARRALGRSPSDERLISVLSARRVDRLPRETPISPRVLPAFIGVGPPEPGFGSSAPTALVRGQVPRSSSLTAEHSPHRGTRREGYT